MKHRFHKAGRSALSLILSLLMITGTLTVAFASISGVPTRTDTDNWFGDATLYRAEKWDKATDLASLTFIWDAYSSSIGYDPQPGTLTYTYPSHIYLNVGETLEAAGYMGHMTASYGENEGDATDFRVMLSSATWGESTRDGFSPVGDLISNYGHQGTCTEGSKLMSGSASHYDFSNDGRGSDQIIGNKSGDNENFLADNESVVVWRSNIQWTGSDMNNFDEYVLLTGTASKTGEVTFNPTESQNFTIGAAQRYTAFAWHSDNGTRFNRYAMNGGSRPQTTPAEDALSITVTVYDKSELSRLIAAADNGELSVEAAALANAKAVLANREVTQDEIDAAAASIGDKMTLLVNANEPNYSSSGADAGLGTDANTFDGEVYHFEQKATEAYNNVVWAPAASSEEGVATSYVQYKYDNCYYRFYTPTATVLAYTHAYDENDDTYTPKSPVMFQFVGDGRNNNRAVYYFANAAANTNLPFENYWEGFVDGSQNNRDYLTNADKVWANNGNGSTYINGTVTNSGWAMTDNQGNKSTWRGFWNFFKYVGNGDTNNYYESFSTGNGVNLTLRHKWNATIGSDDDTYGNLEMPGTVYVLNYKPIYDQLDDAAAVKAIIEGDTAWQYTEASIKRAKGTIMAMIAANPNNFTYEGNVAQGVADCAAAIKDAVYMLDNDGLVLEKKQGTVTFVSQTGETLAINGQPATYTKNYGETIAANEIPQISNVYYRADNAQWDYSEDLDWDPALPATITVSEPEVIFQISDSQTVQTYNVTFFDEDGTTELASAAWQYGDYPDYGGTVIKAAGDVTADTSAPTKQDYDYNYEVTGWKDGEGTAFNGLNATLNSLVADGSNYNSRRFLEGDKFTKYVAVYTATARTDADYAAYNAALAAAQAVLNIPGLDSAAATAIQTAINAEVARAHDDQGRNFRSDDEAGVAAIATAVTNLNAIVLTYTDGEGNLKPDFVAEYTITWNYTTADGAQSTTTTVAYGEVPTAPEAATGNYETSEFSYTFSGWDSELVAVTGAATYTAQYSSTGKPVDYTNMEYALDKAAEAIGYAGINAEAKAALEAAVETAKTDGYDTYPTKKTFAEDGAQQTVDAAAQALLDTLLTYANINGQGDVTVKDDYRTRHTLTFIARCGDKEFPMYTQTETYGWAVMRQIDNPADIRIEDKVWTFSSWSDGHTGGQGVVVLGDATIYADYTLTDQTAKYAVKFVNDDNYTQISASNYGYNATVAVPAETPVSTNRTKEFDYTFLGWSDGTTTYAPDEIPAVTADVTYTAVYEDEAHSRIYHVKWVYGTANTLAKEVDLPYNTVFTAENVPADIVTKDDKVTHNTYSWSERIGHEFASYIGNTTTVVTITATSDKVRHSGTPVYTWTGNDADGYTACTGTLTCELCGEVITEVAEEDNFKTFTDTATDCRSISSTTFRAYFDNSYFSNQDKIVTGAAGPHDFSHYYTDNEPTYAWTYTDRDHVTCTATQKCRYCDATDVETVDALVLNEVSEANCVETEQTEYVAEFERFDNVNKIFVTAPINPAAHDYSNDIDEERSTRPVYDEATGTWSKATLVYNCENTYDSDTGEYDHSHDKIVENVDRADYSEYDATLLKLKELVALDIDDDTPVEYQQPYMAQPVTVPFSFVKDAANTRINDGFPLNYVEPEQDRVDNQVDYMKMVISVIFNEDGTVKDGLLNEYTVTWMNGTTELKKDVNVVSGTVVSYDGSAPTKAETAEHTYSFIGWNSDATADEALTELKVTSDVTYYAIFEELEKDAANYDAYNAALLALNQFAAENPTINADEIAQAISNAAALAHPDGANLKADRQNDVDAATNILTDALTEAQAAKDAAAAQAIADAKQELADKITEGENTDTTNATDEHKNALEDAINDGNDVLADDDATLEEIQAAIDAIDDAIDDIKADDEAAAAQAIADAKQELADKIAEGEATDTTNATDEHKNALDDAINGGNDVLADDDATLEEIQAAIDAIDDAIDDIKADDAQALEDAKQELADKIAEGENTDTTNATDEHKNALDDAIAGGNDVLADDDATLEEIQDAIKAIDDAINDIKADDEAAAAQALEDAKQELADKIAEGEATDKTNATDEHKNALDDAINGGNDVLADDDATLEEIRAAIDAIDDAIDDIKADDAQALDDAKNELEDLLDDAKGADTDDATDETKTALDEAIAKAEDALDDDPLDKDKIDEALQDLQDAIDALRYTVDTSALVAAIANGNTELAKGYYTEQTTTALSDAIAAGAAALANAATNAPKAEYDSSKAAVDAATDAINRAIANLKIDNGDYSAFNAANEKATALKNNEFITDDAKAAIAAKITEAMNTAYERDQYGELHSYKKDNQAKIDEGTNILTDIIAAYVDEEGNLKDEFKQKMDLTYAEDKVKAAENGKDNYTDESKAAIENAITAVEDYLRENGIDVNAGHEYENNAIAADNTEFKAGLDEKLAELQDAINNATKLPADYSKYDELIGILETIRDDEAITDKLHNQIVNKLDNQLPRDLTKDQQNIIDNEVASIVKLLDQILEKDGDGNYTSDVKDSAKTHYVVIFNYLGKSKAVSVVKGSDATAPQVAEITGVDGRTEGHYVFKGWDKEFTNVQSDLVVNGVFETEAHTDADNNNHCEVCGCKIDTSFKCGMCAFYEKNKNIPVIGWFIMIIHFFVHLAQSISHVS